MDGRDEEVGGESLSVSTSLRWCHAGIKRVIKVYGAIIECEKRSCSVVLKIEIFLVRAKIDFLIAFLQS